MRRERSSKIVMEREAEREREREREREKQMDEGRYMLSVRYLHQRIKHG